MKTLSVKRTVRPATTKKAAPSPVANVRKAIQPERIVVPVDFSSESEKAVKYAAALARRFGSTLVLIHVVEPVAYPADFGYGPLVIDLPGKEILGRIQARLNTVGKKFAGENLKVTTHVLHGAAYHEIIEAARVLKADLIVVGTHGYTGLSHALMGSTAEKVVRHAPCPVIVVREHEREFVRIPKRD